MDNSVFNNNLAKILEEYPNFKYHVKGNNESIDYASLRDTRYGKVRYETREEAELALIACRKKKTRRNNGSRVECAIYQDVDGGWYLTSNSKHRRKLKQKFSNNHSILSNYRSYSKNKVRKINKVARL